MQDGPLSVPKYATFQLLSWDRASAHRAARATAITRTGTSSRL